MPCGLWDKVGPFCMPEGNPQLEHVWELGPCIIYIQSLLPFCETLTEEKFIKSCISHCYQQIRLCLLGARSAEWSPIFCSQLSWSQLHSKISHIVSHFLRPEWLKKFRIMVYKSNRVFFESFHRQHQFSQLKICLCFSPTLNGKQRLRISILQKA